MTADDVAATTDGYAVTLTAAKAAIQAARTRAVLAANSELIGLYWQLGQLILERQAAEGPRTKVIARLSTDLRHEFPEMKGLSPGNLDYMRRLAAAWPPSSLQLVGNIPWGHNQLLLDRLDDQPTREWYAQSAIEHGWSRAILAHEIMSQLHRRAGAAPSNFADALPAGDSELMQQLTKDPYNLEFLELATPVAERELERALVAQVERFLLELGSGFAFVGRQWHLQLDDDEFFIDLLMFHIPTSRFLCTTGAPAHDRFAPSRNKIRRSARVRCSLGTSTPARSLGARTSSPGSSGALTMTPDPSIGRVGER